MSNDKQQSENEQMSMEQILSSIRQVIVEEERHPSPFVKVAQPEPASADFLDLTDPLDGQEESRDYEEPMPSQQAPALEMEGPPFDVPLQALEPIIAPSAPISLAPPEIQGTPDQPAAGEATREAALAEANAQTQEAHVQAMAEERVQETQIQAETAREEIEEILDNLPRVKRNNEEDEPLISQDPAVSTNTAFSKLAMALEMKQAAQQDAVGGKTVNSLMQEVLRPLMKEWLDQNLPDIVNKLVAKEIDRIANL